MRIGWIFKTESIVIPAVLDSIGGAAWLRGFLPLLNRIGHSIPPIVASSSVARLPRKRNALIVCTIGMAISILLLGGLLAIPGSAWWKPAVFLVLYLSFFCATGVNQLAGGTLQGKLVPTERRGRLMMAANVIGGGAAVTAAALLMPLWLSKTDSNFPYLFLFAGSCFFLSAGLGLCLCEFEDADGRDRETLAKQFYASWTIFKTDQQFRSLAIIAMLFGSSITLFPHYQAIGRERLQLDTTNLTLWVVVQNVGMAVFSLGLGPLADRYGYRAVLRCTLLGLGLLPWVALSLTNQGAVGSKLYPLVFVLVGLTPVTIRAISNFTLELCSREDHPRYLSTIGLCTALPLFFSPVAGWLIDTIGYETVFRFTSILVLLGWVQTLFVSEPRTAANEN